MRLRLKSIIANKFLRAATQNKAPAPNIAEQYYLKKKDDQTQLAYLTGRGASEFLQSLGQKDAKPVLKVALDESFQFFPYNYVFGEDSAKDRQAEFLLRNAGSKSVSVKEIRDVMQQEADNILSAVNHDRWSAWGLDEETYQKAAFLYDSETFPDMPFDLHHP